MIRLTPPTVPRFVNSGWGAPRAYRGGVHEGLDFPAKVGTPILASAPGVVAFVKNVDNSFAGKHTVIDHGGGVYTRYLHAEKNFKKVGDRVQRGEKIGIVGITGTSGKGSPHVHFDVRMLPAALAEYQRRFGAPVSGFGKSMAAFGKAVPAEAIMDKADYRPGVVIDSVKRGVKFFKSSPFSIAIIVAIAGGGYLLYRQLSK